MKHKAGENNRDFMEFLSVDLKTDCIDITRGVLNVWNQNTGSCGPDAG